MSPGSATACSGGAHRCRPRARAPGHRSAAAPDRGRPVQARLPASRVRFCPDWTSAPDRRQRPERTPRTRVGGVDNEVVVVAQSPALRDEPNATPAEQDVRRSDADLAHPEMARMFGFDEPIAGCRSRCCTRSWTRTVVRCRSVAALLGALRGTPDRESEQRRRYVQLCSQASPSRCTSGRTTRSRPCSTDPPRANGIGPDHRWAVPGGPAARSRARVLLRGCAGEVRPLWTRSPRCPVPRPVTALRATPRTAGRPSGPVGSVVPPPVRAVTTIGEESALSTTRSRSTRCPNTGCGSSASG